MENGWLLRGKAFIRGLSVWGGWSSIIFPRKHDVTAVRSNNILPQSKRLVYNSFWPLGKVQWNRAYRGLSILSAAVCRMVPVEASSRSTIKYRSSL